MKNHGIRIFACFVVVLMLVSIFPTGALAASDNGNNDKSKSNDIKGNGIKANEDRSDDQTDDGDDDSGDIDDSKITGKEKNARSDYKDAKVKFTNIKSKNPNLNTEEAINGTKDYLNDTIDYMISILDENNTYIDDLEEERENVEGATTREELAESAKNIRDIWNDARKDRVTSASKAINNKINGVLQASENLMVRLENEINTMEENGEDVEDLREMVEEYKELIEEAKNKQEQARETYMNGNGNNGENIREANRYVVEAGKDIKDANGILRNILKELKQEREGVVVLSGNGTLYAEGNGTAVISGNVTINITADDHAKLVIKDLAEDAEINVSGAEYESSNIDSGNSTDNNRAFVFINITGQIDITGSRLTVMISGDDIELYADGTGTAVLSGDGTYEIGNEEGDWAERYIDDDEEEELEEEEEEEEEIDEEDEDENKDDEEDDENVTVVANFTYTVDGLNVTFNDTSMNASSWNWDFDDGNSSTEQDPTHEYAQYDEYNITLTAYESDNDKLNNDSITQTINLTV